MINLPSVTPKTPGTPHRPGPPGPPGPTPPRPPHPFEDDWVAWVEFIRAFQRVLAYRRVRPPFGHLVEVRENTIAMAVSDDMRESMLFAFESAATKLLLSHPSGNGLIATTTQPSGLYVQELRAYPKAVSTFENQAALKGSGQKWVKKLCGVGGTILGSGKDFVDDNGYAKAVISGLKEMADIFK